MAADAAAQDSTGPPSDAGFEVVRRGYDQGQVETHLRRLDAEIRILTTDRDAAMDQSAQLGRELDDSRVRAEKLRAQVRTLVSPPQSVQGMSERMRSMLRLAEDEVGDMLGRAETEASRRTREADVQAAQTVAAAQAEADAIQTSVHADARSSAQELDRARAELDAERQAVQERLASDVARAEQERSRAWAESESRRALVEQDFVIAMNQRRSDSLAQLTAEQREARREVEELRESAATTAREEVEQAERTARALVDDAHRRVRELVALRGRIVEQLGGTRAVLDRSLDGLAPLPDERAEGTDGAAAREAVSDSDRRNGPRPERVAAGRPTAGDRA